MALNKLLMQQGFNLTIAMWLNLQQELKHEKRIHSWHWVVRFIPSYPFDGGLRLNKNDEKCWRRQASGCSFCITRVGWKSTGYVKKRKLLLLSVWSMLRSEAQLHKVLVYQPLLYFGTCQAEAHSRKGVVGLFLQKNRSVCLWNICLKLSDWLVPINRDGFQCYVFNSI